MNEPKTRMVEVYFRKPTEQNDLENISKESVLTERTHRKVHNLIVQCVSQVYDLMQGAVWSPNGEARPLIKKLGLTHTSMSEGDAVHDLHTGEVFLCISIGWQKLHDTPVQTPSMRPIYKHMSDALDYLKGIGMTPTADQFLNLRGHIQRHMNLYGDFFDIEVAVDAYLDELSKIEGK